MKLRKAVFVEQGDSFLLTRWLISHIHLPDLRNVSSWEHVLSWDFCCPDRQESKTHVKDKIVFEHRSRRWLRQSR